MEEKKVEEKQSVPEWKRKWIASRMTFESILFERELLTQKKEKNYRGIIGFILIFLFQFSLLWLYFFRNNGILTFQDIEKIKVAENYFSSFSNAEFWEMLKVGQVSPNLDMPFYYFSFFAVFKYLVKDYSWSVFVLNSIYMFIIMLVVYLILSIKRNYQSAVYGITFLSSMPFLINLARHFSPQLATIVFVCLTYFFFIKSEEFEDNRWIFPMSLSISFGVLTDKFFLLYILPIVPWLGYAIGGVFRASMIKGLLPGIIIGIPFYLRLLVQIGCMFITSGQEFLKNKNFNLFWYLFPTINALQIIFFAIGGLTLLWMYYSLFMPYEKRKIIGKWFFFSYIAFWLIPFKQENYIYPALIPFAIAAAIMTPRMARKFLFYFILIFSFINQSGLISEKFLNIKNKKIGLIGMTSLPFKKEKIEDIITLIKENVMDSNVVVSVFGGNEYLNSNTLGILSAQHGIKNVKFTSFVNDLIYFPDILIVKGEENLKKLPLSFYNLFQEKLSFNSRDITIFAKKIPENSIIKDTKTYKIKEFAFNGINFSDVIINFGEFDELKKIYKSADIFISYANKEDVDSYGINLSVKDLCLISQEKNIIFCGISGIQIKNLRVTDFSLARFIENKFSILKNVSIEIDKDIELSGKLKEKDFTIGGNLEFDKKALIFSVNKFSYSGFELPAWLYHFLNFKLNFNSLPISVDIGAIKMKKAMIEIS